MTTLNQILEHVDARIRFHLELEDEKAILKADLWGNNPEMMEAVLEEVRKAGWLAFPTMRMTPTSPVNIAIDFINNPEDFGYEKYPELPYDPRMPIFRKSATRIK